MSGIAAIYHLDGRLADPGILEKMTQVIAHRGPDGIRHWLDGEVALGHCLLATTPDAQHQQQPLLDETGCLGLVLDGRVDNRDALRATLAGLGFPPRSGTDAELVLRAYECWGEECPRRIVGDFAWVLWDGLRRQLFAARDCQGVRPFYYCLHDGTLYCGSELRQLLEIPGRPREPNEGMAAEYLADRITNLEETLWRGLVRLPPAHYLVIREGRLVTRRYWTPEPSWTIRYRTQEQYDEHFLTLMREVIGCRLRSDGPLAAELSGGLDSSLIVCMAGQLVRETGSPALTALSMVFPGQPCDESEYIDAVVKRCGVEAHQVIPRMETAAFYAAQVRRYGDFPDYPNGTMGDALKQLANQSRHRVVLTGLGGDEWLTGSTFYYADHLRHLRLRQLVSWLRHDVSSLGFRGTAGRFVRQGLLPLLSMARFSAKNTDEILPIPKWLSPEFARRVELQSRLRRAPALRGCPSPSRTDLFTQGSSGLQVHSQEMEERGAARFGIEQRHPFYDRRFVEFALALPEEQRQTTREIKHVLRHAMRNIVPEKVRTRATKADFSTIFAQALLGLNVDEWFTNPIIAELGWVDRAQPGIMYRQLFQAFRAGDEQYARHVWPLWLIFGIELWYRVAVCKGFALEE